jgi:hypothetical protein
VIARVTSSPEPEKQNLTAETRRIARIAEIAKESKLKTTERAINLGDFWHLWHFEPMA